MPAIGFAAASPVPVPPPTSALPMAPTAPSADGAVAPAPTPTMPAFSGALSVAAGDMTDVVRVSFKRGSRVAAWRVERAASPSGPWSVVVSRTTRSSISARVPSARVWYYRVRTIAPSGRLSAPSAPVGNDTVAMSRVVGTAGATLRASNGTVALTLPPGTFASGATVTVRSAAAPGSASIVRVTGVYSFTASAPLRRPVRVVMPYRIPVQHFQVAATVAKAIDWMYWDDAAGRWAAIPTSVDTTAGTLTADMPHFSYWEGAFIQPHGTSPTKTDYCGTVCHDLAISPVDGTALSITDSRVCYNCHGNTSAAAPAAGSTGRNVQADFFACSGQSTPAGSSAHPVRLPGGTTGLTCVACHDPHGNPASAPNLLRAYDAVTGRAVASANATEPGTAFCWTCHGARKNVGADSMVSGYWSRAGDKRTTFNGAHTALGTATWRYDSEAELKRGNTGSTTVRADGTVALAGTILLPKTPTPPVTASPTPIYYSSPAAPWAAYDGKVSTIFQWFAKDMGAAGVTPSNPKVGTAYLTVDLGSVTSVSSFECYFDTSVAGGAFNTDVLEIRTSNDNVSWQTIGTSGIIGIRSANPATVALAAPVTGRYVRFVFSREFSESEWNSICPGEVNIYGPPTQGTFEVRPDIARKAAYTGGTIRWVAQESQTATVGVDVRASTNNGSTWTAWAPVANGAAITQIAAGASLEFARLQVRSTLSGVGSSPVLDSIQIDLNRGAITGTTPAWTGSSPANQCRRCHVGHSSASGGLVSATSSASCKNCHSGTYGSYTGATQFAASKHASVACASCHTAHGTPTGTGITYAFLLRGERADACFNCHTDVRDAFDAKRGVASEWAKHDVRAAEQVVSTSSMTCRNCHATHSSSSGLVDPDAAANSFTALRDDPASIPTNEIVIEASKDALLDSTAGQQTWNYGASTQVTITPSTRLLTYFDLSAIPAGATIKNATLVLWGTSGTSTTYKGGYLVYPIARDWFEGTGTGTANSSGVNGATWLEWKYGDNANTGNTAAGDWASLGGDRGAAGTYDAGGIAARNVTTLVQSLVSGPNYGIMIGPYDATTSLPMYTRHNVSAQYRPRLRIVYATGPATRQAIDDITFCSKCHDGTMPSGMSGQTMSAVANLYQYGAHGAKKGIGSESDAFGYWGFDRGGGGLKAPYYYGMDALPCTTCHDPHGSRLPYHLRETINGQTVVPPYGYTWTYEIATKGEGLGYFCAACHVFPTNHSGYQTSLTGCASGCHSHAGK